MHRSSTLPASPSTILSLSSISYSTASISCRVLYLCLCVLVLLPLCASQCDPCTPGGCGALDLTSYTGEHAVTSQSSGANYYMMMCQDDQQSCNGNGQLCKKPQYEDQASSLGSHSSATWKLNNPNDASQGATLSLSGGSDSEGGCPDSVTATLAVICGTNNDGFSLGTEGGSGSCAWTFTFNSMVVCKLPAGSGSGASGHGLSGGSIFLILFFVTAFVYFTGGIIFNKYRRGLSGVELIPNVGFWRDLPGLVKDGCIFSFNKVRALFGGARTGSLASKGTGSTYETI